MNKAGEFWTLAYLVYLNNLGKICACNSPNKIDRYCRSNQNNYCNESRRSLLLLYLINYFRFESFKQRPFFHTEIIAY